ncbi:MAG: glycosyltransferase [Alphaproteobacteria bacterium]
MHGMKGPCQRIALFVDRLTQGGVQHSFLGLAQAFLDRGLDVDLVVGERKGHHGHALPPGLRLRFLHDGGVAALAVNALRAEGRTLVDQDRRLVHGLPLRYRSFLPALVAYLASERPAAMLSAKTLGNLTAILARRRAGVATRLVISERGHVSESIRRSGKRWKAAGLPSLMRALYPLADGIVAISSQVADDLADLAKLERSRVVTIHNALLRPDGLDLPPAEHPWFGDGPPVILGAGRLGRQKDFPTLLRAFALLRARRKARLMIIGEGEDRASLQHLAKSLGVGEDVLLPGFQENPFAFMKAVDLFVLSSTHEGFGNVLLEALAAGCPVVSTDCPAGPAEILDGGRFGRLVPVGDPGALAEAIVDMLDRPPAADPRRARAADFSMERTAERYLRCLLPERADGTVAAQLGLGLQGDQATDDQASADLRQILPAGPAVRRDGVVPAQANRDAGQAEHGPEMRQ